MPATAQQVKKISIIGAGRIGTELWRHLLELGVAAEISIYNRPDERETNSFKGLQLALEEEAIISGRDSETYKKIAAKTLTENLEESLTGADIVIVTAGATLQVGQTRAQLLETNYAIIDRIAAAAAKCAPSANYIVTTNPVDAMTQRLQEKSGIAADQIIGLNGELDWSRLVQSISRHLNVPINDIRGAAVIGQHSDEMVPVLSTIEVRQPDGSWAKLTSLLAHRAGLEETIRQDTIQGGPRFVPLIGTTDYIGPTAALSKMIMHIIRSRSNASEPPIYCSAFAADEGIYTGRPVRFDAHGKYSVLPLPVLSAKEKEEWTHSLNVSRELLNKLRDRNAAAA